MATVTALIEETRRVLFSGQREGRNKLSIGVTASDTSLTFAYPMGGIRSGSKLSINLEDIYVWDTASQTASPVDRGQFGSTAAIHDAGTIAHVNPKFSNWEIFNALNDEILSLSTPHNGLYAISTIQLTYSPTIQGYNFSLPTAIDIYEVRYEVPGPSMEQPLSTDWELSRGMPTTDFASGVALFVRDAYPNYPVTVKAKIPYPQLTASLAATTSPTIPDSVIDLLSIGAAWRLTQSREVRRNFDEVQGDTRRADEVPPGANMGASRELGRLRQQRINEEASRLNQLYPNRSRRYPYQASYS